MGNAGYKGKWREWDVRSNTCVNGINEWEGKEQGKGKIWRETGNFPKTYAIIPQLPVVLQVQRKEKYKENHILSYFSKTVKNLEVNHGKPRFYIQRKHPSEIKVI